uniref:MH2 domain-containing protein n=1 Tax=Romanomermis culicivorax TaxID=13658 RepID=A0A915JRI0_ROMCU
SCTTSCVYYLAYWERSTKIGNSITVDNPLLFCFNKGNTNNNSINHSKNASRKRIPDLHFAQYCDLRGPTTSSNVTADDDLKPSINDLCRTIRQKIGRGFALYVAPVDKISNSNDGLEYMSEDYSTYYSAFNRKEVDDSKKSWRSGDFIVLHNRGPLTLYIQSNFLTEILDDETETKNNQTGRFLKSRRLLPGQAIIVQKIGFFKKTLMSANENDSTGQDSASVLISFSKCWGLDQKRHLITYCPCWVEVIFPIR